MSSAAPPQPPRSILVIKPSSFGDVVHTLPAVARLKGFWPEARLTWLVNSEWAPLLQGNPDVDEVLPFPRKDFRGWSGAARFLRWCKAVVTPLRPDLAIDFQGLLRSAWIGRASRPKHFFGLADAREGARWFYDHSAPLTPEFTHAVTRCLAGTDFAADTLCLLARERQTECLRWFLPAGEPPELDQEFTLNGFILLHPFSRGKGKSLSISNVLQICQQVAPRFVVLAGQHFGEPIVGLPARCLNLLNQTSLGQLVWLIRHCAFMVTVDSGPAHLAAALRRPMVAIHTWSDPRLVGPFREDAWVWKNGAICQAKDLPTSRTAFPERPWTGLRREDVEAISKLAISS